ncbi:hypothetical protein FB107DRAFT_280158 [Schizophyllum commune]
MPPPGTVHFTALGALTRAKGDSQAIDSVLAEHEAAFVEIMSGARGAAIQQSAQAIIDDVQPPSTGGAPQLSAAAPATLPLTAHAGSPSAAPLPGPVPALAPDPQAQRTTTRTPRVPRTAMRDLSAPSLTPMDPPSTSPPTARSSTTRPSPETSRPHGDAGTARISTGNTKPSAVTKRKHDADDAPQSPTASEASGNGRQLRGRNPKISKKVQPSTRKTTTSHARGTKGKKRAIDAQDDSDDADVDEEDDVDTVVVKKAPPKNKTSRITTRPRPHRPKPSLVNDPPCDACLDADVECLRRETSRPSYACQRCFKQKLGCSLAKTPGSSRPRASDGGPASSSRAANPAPAVMSAPAAPALPYQGAHAQDPLALAQSYATLTELCGHMERFNRNFSVMEALQGNIIDFHTYVDRLLVHRQAIGGLPALPPPPAPSVPSRDVSPASQGSRKRRRIERDTEGSASTAHVGGAPTPLGTIVGGSGGAGLPADGTAPPSGEMLGDAGLVPGSGALSKARAPRRAAPRRAPRRPLWRKQAAAAARLPRWMWTSPAGSSWTATPGNNAR